MSNRIVNNDAVQRRSGRGFSLVEAIVVLTVISILVAMAVPSYRRTLEQSRVDLVAGNLRAIWSAQRLYWLEYRQYTTDLDALRAMGVLDPAAASASCGFTYSITSANQSEFTAVATRSGSSAWSGELSINETGEISGTVQAEGQQAISPGFQ